MNASRPNWYKRYHEHPISEWIHWGTLVFSLFILLAGFGNLAFLADAAKVTTIITQEVLPGDLGFSLPEFVFFTPVFSDFAVPQTTTALLKGLIISDERGFGDTDWTVTASCTNFFSINQPVKQTGTNDTLSAGGIYDFPKGGVYLITITKGGGVGTAKFKVDGLELQSGLVAGNTVKIGSRGVWVTFAPTDYIAGDSWVVRVDAIPVSNLTIFPQNLTTTSSLQGISLGSRYSFTGTNDIANILKANQEHKPGEFGENLQFSLVIPPFTFANRYSAILTITTD